MTFEISRLICDVGVCRCVRLIESVGCERRHIVKNIVGNLGGDSPLDTAVTFNRSVLTHHTVDKVLAFLFHNVVLLFGHRTAYNIGSSV